MTLRNKAFILIPLFVLVLSVFIAPDVKAECRFWAAIAEKTIPADVITDGLLKGDNSVCGLSRKNRDGWGLAYYENGRLVLLKGAGAAYEDGAYSDAVLKIARAQPRLMAAHVRAATSGCRGKDVKNPHPFSRSRDGKDWLFGHNGSVSKRLVEGLIGGEYLDNNLPQVCNDDPPASWVDSELYFIFLLKSIDEADGNVEAGIRHAFSKLKKEQEGRGGALNFFLSDGDTLWALRSGHSLYYYWDPVNRHALVASMHTFSDKGAWAEVPENSLIIMKKGEAPFLFGL